jgi:hypothetical protein
VDKFTLKATEPLNTNKHDRKDFSSGVVKLDTYLWQQADKESKQNISQTFVLTSHEKPNSIMGYYTLSASSIQIDNLPDEIAIRLPKYKHVGVTLLGRFAIAEQFQKKGLKLGEHLLVDAKLKTWKASQVVASFALVVDILTAEKGDPTDFYLKYDFIAFPKTNNKLYLPMKTIERMLKANGLIK